METYKKGMDLIDYLDILWKRRWIIIVPTILFTLIAGIVSFIIPSKWAVDAVIQPSKFFVQSEPGTFTEVLVMDPKQLTALINQGSYNGLIAADLNIDPRDLPKIAAENLRDAKLVRVSLKIGDKAKARLILNALFEHIRSELDRKIDVASSSITTQIALKENEIKARELDIRSRDIEIEKTRQEIVAAGNKLKISEERSRGLLEEMKIRKARIGEIEKRQRTMLAEKPESIEALGLLLYSNEIQQNFGYYDALEESLSKEKNAQEDLRLSARMNEQVIRGLRTEIDKISQAILALRSDMALLDGKRQRVDFARLIKEPAASSDPVSPRKTANVVIAGSLSLLCFSMLALFLDSVKKRNSRPRTGS